MSDTQELIRDEARMGEFLRVYEPEQNVHTFINGLFTHPTYAFDSTISAVIVQQKEFPDVSFYQGDVEMAKMRAKTDACVFRAGQNLWVDKEWVNNWRKSKEQGMFRGAYWFYDDRIDPGRQADIFIDLLKADPPEMEVWCDWENSYGGAFGSLRDVVAFMQKVENAGFKIGMYTGYYWFIAHSNAILHASQYAWLKTRPLWLAWYTHNSANVLIPAPWSILLLWQYGTPSVGLAYGCKTIELDMNYINLTTEEFYYRYDDGSTTPIPPGGDMKIYEVIWANGVARRTKPTTSGSSTTLPAYGFGTQVNVLEDNIPDQADPTNTAKKWVKFEDGYYGASDYPNASNVPKQRMVKISDGEPPEPEPGELPVILKGFDANGNEVAGATWDLRT